MENYITIGCVGVAALLFVGPTAWNALKGLWTHSTPAPAVDWPTRQVTHLRALVALDGDLATDAKPHTDALRVMVATRAPTVTGGKP